MSFRPFVCPSSLPVYLLVYMLLIWSKHYSNAKKKKWQFFLLSENFPQQQMYLSPSQGTKEQFSDTLPLTGKIMTYFNYLDKIPPPPILRSWSTSPPLLIRVDLARVLIAIVPRIWGASSFQRGWMVGSCLQLATAMASILRWVRKRCVIILKRKRQIKVKRHND